MPCTSQRPQKADEVKLALDRLEKMLTGGAVNLRIGPNGAIFFEGWLPMDRKGFSDVCAFTALQASGSFALQRAIQQAEIMAGRKIDQAAIAAGVHTHDGGRTWAAGHSH